MIYLKSGKKNIKTVSDLLVALYATKNYGNHSLRATITYKDEECEIVQCPEGRTRSFDDVNQIILTYFPEMELKDIVFALITFKHPLHPHMMFPYYCKDIARPTLYYMAYPLSDHTYSTIAYEKGETSHNWSELLGLLGIKKMEELYDFINKHRDNETPED